MKRITRYFSKSDIKLLTQNHLAGVWLQFPKFQALSQDPLCLKNLQQQRQGIDPIRLRLWRLLCFRKFDFEVLVLILQLNLSRIFQRTSQKPSIQTNVSYY
jgi:hypothetical protein